MKGASHSEHPSTDLPEETRRNANIFYTLGYAQWAIDEVDDQIDTLDAVLVDVRYSPHTTKPGFANSNLANRFGDRYVHLPAFGNVNYKEGPIELAAPDKGLHAVCTLERAPVLMCGCQSPERCHRSTVAHFLTDHLGGSIEHLRAPSERAQPGLFDDTPET
jgi:uncharacterized protein (DUF488 family)